MNYHAADEPASLAQSARSQQRCPPTVRVACLSRHTSQTGRVRRNFMVRVLLCFALVVTSQGATLEWDANPPSDAVTNYVVHWGTNAASAGTNLSYSLTNFAPGVYRFTLTAQANGVESLPSEELAWTNRPAVPAQLRIKVSLRSKTSLDGPWEQELQFTEIVLPDDRSRFFQTELTMERSN